MPVYLRYQQGDYEIDTDPARLDVDAIHAFLHDSYWAEGIPRQLVCKSIEHALCYGVYRGDTQVGFARVVTDYATFAYLADVFILEPHRGQGLSKWLLSCILAHPELGALRAWMLATRDAHGLYARYGFRPLTQPDRFMRRVQPDAYRRKQI